MLDRECRRRRPARMVEGTAGAVPRPRRCGRPDAAEVRGRAGRAPADVRVEPVEGPREPDKGLRRRRGLSTSPDARRATTLARFRLSRARAWPHVSASPSARSNMAATMSTRRASPLRFNPIAQAPVQQERRGDGLVARSARSRSRVFGLARPVLFFPGQPSVNSPSSRIARRCGGLGPAEDGRTHACPPKTAGTGARRRAPGTS